MQLLAVPGADRPPGGGAGRARRRRQRHPIARERRRTADSACSPRRASSIETSSTSTSPSWQWAALLALHRACCCSSTCWSSTARPHEVVDQGGGDRDARSGSASASSFGLVICRRARRGRRPASTSRLPDREEPVGRQRVRLGGDLQLLRGAAGVPAPGAVLGHLRRARAAGDLHLRRRRARSSASSGSSTSSARSCSTPACEAAASRRGTRSHPEHNPVLQARAPGRAVDDEYDGQKLFTQDRRASGWRRRCSPCWSWSRRPT